MFGGFQFGGAQFGGAPQVVAASSAQTLIEGLRVFLAATTNVIALTGLTNLFPMQGQQASVSPRIVYVRESEVDDDTLERGETDSPTAQVRLLCYGGRWGEAPLGGYKTARNVADTVKLADGGLGGLGGLKLRSYRGKLGLVVCQSCRLIGDEDQHSDPTDASGRGEEWVELTFSIAYLRQT